MGLDGLPTQLFDDSVEEGLFLSPGKDLGSWGHNSQDAAAQGPQYQRALPGWAGPPEKHRNTVRRIRTAGTIPGV